uniref:Cyclin-J-like protein n=1 Tax=Pelodiscus sinensis TaxID=13735 RepID=K7FXE9_PELSI
MGTTSPRVLRVEALRLRGRCCNPRERCCCGCIEWQQPAAVHKDSGQEDTGGGGGEREAGAGAGCVAVFPAWCPLGRGIYGPSFPPTCRAGADPPVAAAFPLPQHPQDVGAGQRLLPRVRGTEEAARGELPNPSLPHLCMGRMRLEEQWWKGELAADIHQTLRLKELKLPVYKAHSPQIGMRRYFTDLLGVLSSRCSLCPTARHLAVYLLDLFMDHYDITVKQLYVISIACLLLASKFEEKEARVPKLEQLNNLVYLYNVNMVLNKKDLLKMELLLLESFNWNLCLPTPAHYIDYYLFASVGENDLHNGWPITSLGKVKAFMEKYAYYFLDFSVQDYAFLSFRPSLIAAACVCASRICMQISPSWTTQLQLLTCYSWEHLAQCIEMMLIYYENDVKEASKMKKQVTLQQQEVESMDHQTTTQASLQSAVQTLPLQAPITMQVAIATEPRHCISMAYGSSYFSGHHSYTARCFDR